MADNKRNIPGGRPGGTPGNQKPGGKPKFNSYWIIGIILLVMILIQFLSSNGNLKEINSTRFFEILEKGDVESLVIINEKRMEVYIRNERLADSQYEDFKGERPSTVLGQPLPQCYVTISYESMLEKTDDIISGLPSEQVPDIKHETRRNYMGDILLWVVPFLLILGIWIFMLRRMGGGGGGGAGSNIFNVGKSRAQVFDKDTNVKVDFSDVAGLEEAKVEIREIVEFLKNPKKYTELCWCDPREQGSPYWLKQLQGRPMCHSSPCQVPISWKCSSGWVPPG